MDLVSQKRFINEALEFHNECRKMHGVHPLDLDQDLVKSALEWAELLAKTQTFRYSFKTYKSEPIGENILKCDLTNTGKIYYSGKDATNKWYEQNNMYQYDGTFSPEIGNFTQVVWRKTKKVGFGFALTEDLQFYVVAHYWPAGNIKNQYKENVFEVLPQTPLEPNKMVSPFYSSPKPSRQSSPKIMRTSFDSPKLKESIYLNNQPSKINNNYKQELENYSPELKVKPKPVLSEEEMQKKFIKEALDCHNECRMRHGVPGLVHNPELSMIALDYAKKLAKLGSLVHSNAKYKGEHMGENLAYVFDTSIDSYNGDAATMSWYSEIKKHNFQQDSQPGTGHFSQLVWKATKEVGFGVAKASDGSFYAVANYFPAGNLIGRFVVNVPRPIY